MIKVNILDDHVIVSEGLKMLINSSNVAIVQNVFHTVAECRSTLAENEDNCSDVLLLDIQLPDGNGIEYCAELKTLYPELKILMLTMFDEVVIARRALLSGADGFLLKNTNMVELMESFATVLRGEQYICEAMSGKLQCTDIEESKIIWLSNREKEILPLIAQGFSDRAIADKIFLSYETVRDYHKKLLSKFVVHSTIELVQKARMQMLI